MSYRIVREGDVYYLKDGDLSFGPFECYKETTDFMEEASILYEYGINNEQIYANQKYGRN